MNIKVECLPKYRIAYMRQTGPYGPNNIHVMRRLKEWAKENKLLTESAIVLGISQDDPNTTVPESCRFDACIVISNDYQIDDFVSENELPGGEYAIFTVKHTAEDIQRAWTEIFTEISIRGYQIDSKPIFEKYIGEMVNSDYCEICVPICRR
ncbi:MAG TPA: GyrI-like domain-containing protein [Metabacillus sp.]|nr:GyrI-like domain-containing protein [Metabacillus sp.]